ncbi:hypothetical protein [Leclercia sp. AS011]|jgi:hypothetical protein|uniref:hypothetical protein n=1 Tax=Leclercia sp. AS011 TaxID=3081257 RepID=UPI00301AA0E8
MPKSKCKNAILVFESPWNLDNYDANRSSVLPFVQGIAKMRGDTEVYFQNFHDKPSFKFALECLCRQKFDNTIVYIAAHGSKNRIGKVSIKDLLIAINEKSREYNIKGLMLGSCFAGSQTHLLQEHTQGSNLRWSAGYSSSCDWLTGTMIDCAIIHSALNLKNAQYKSREPMVKAFASAISPFASNAVIGEDEDENDVQLSDSLKFVIQPEGQGYHALPESDNIFQHAYGKRLAEVA